MHFWKTKEKYKVCVIHITDSQKELQQLKTSTALVEQIYCKDHPWNSLRVHNRIIILSETLSRGKQQGTHATTAGHNASLVPGSPDSMMQNGTGEPGIFCDIYETWTRYHVNRHNRQQLHFHLSLPAVLDIRHS